MIVYVLCILLVYILTTIFMKTNRKSSKFSFLFLILAVLIPSILAGMRDLSVGTDVNVYVAKYYEFARHSNSIFTFFNSYKLDVGYGGVTYLISKISYNVHIFLFFIELLIVFPVFISAYKLKNKIPMNLFCLIYMLTFYNMSFNIVRQSLAISFIILSFTYFITNENKKSLFYAIVAVLFHSTSIIFLIIPIIYKYLNQKLKREKLIAILLVLVLIPIFYSKILLFMINNVGIISSRYSIYLEQLETSNFSAFQIGYRIIIFLILILHSKELKNDNNNFYIAMSFANIIFYLLNNVVLYAGRISFYFSAVANLFGLGIIYYNIKAPKKRIMYFLIIVSILVSYWYIQYIILKSGDTYPFKFF